MPKSLPSVTPAHLHGNVQHRRSGAVAAGVLAFGVLASYLPARRAARLDPCRTFREE
jgi:ABC-type lipoprotein release transport system permease subunit